MGGSDGPGGDSNVPGGGSGGPGGDSGGPEGLIRSGLVPLGAPHKDLVRILQGPLLIVSLGGVVTVALERCSCKTPTPASGKVDPSRGLVPAIWWVYNLGTLSKL